MAIPTDGLIFLASPNFQSSYPGAGSTVTNIAPGSAGETGTMEGSAAKVGKFFDFSTTAGNIDFGEPSSFSNWWGGGQRTILVWMKCNSDGIGAASGTIIGKGTGAGATGWRFYSGFDNGVASSPALVAQGTTTAGIWFVNLGHTLGQWELWAITWSSSSPTVAPSFRKNAVAQTTITQQALVGAYGGDAGNGLGVGGQADTSFGMDGQLGLWAVYEGSLSDSDHAAFYDATKGIYLATEETLAFGRSRSVAAVNGVLDHFDRCNTGAFCDLLPVGAMWPRATDTTLYKTCSAFSLELGRVDRQITKLLDESYPDTTQEMLSGWERNCGLPDTCEEKHGPCAAIPTDNLVFMASPIALDSYPGSGSSVTNIAPLGGQVGTMTAASVAADRFQFNGTSGEIAWSPFAAVNDVFSSGPATVFVRFNAESDGEGDEGTIIAKGDTNTTGRGWRFYVANESGGLLDLVFEAQCATTDGIWTLPGAVTAGTEASASVRWDATTPTTAPVFHVDGDPQVATVTQTPVGAYVSDALVDLSLGNRPEDDRTFDGSQGISLIYKRALTDAEHFAINAITEGAGGILDSLPQRQQNVVNVISQDHVLNDEFWASLARSCGYQPPVISKMTAFCVGQDCTTDPVCGVDALLSVTFTFTSGVNDELLECKIREFWPEYVTLFVVFT